MFWYLWQENITAICCYQYSVGYGTITDSLHEDFKGSEVFDILVLLKIMRNRKRYNVRHDINND